jgi:hypothetical protein
MEAAAASTIEELRSRLGDLEARQRAVGGVADPAWAAWGGSGTQSADTGLHTGSHAEGRTGSRTEGRAEGRTGQAGARGVHTDRDTGGDIDGCGCR